MHPTRASTLLLAGLLGGFVGYLGARMLDAFVGTLPALTWLTPALLVFLASALAAARSRVYRWTAGERLIEPGDALRMARLVALAKAAAVFGAGFAGACLGLLLLVLDRVDTGYGQGYLLRTVVTALASCLVLAAALWLEHECLVDGDETPPGSHPGAAAPDAA